MDPKKEMVQHMMKKMSPGLYKWDPELAKQMWSGCFFSDDESDDEEQHQRKRSRDGLNNGASNLMKRVCSGLTTVSI